MSDIRQTRNFHNRDSERAAMWGGVGIGIAAGAYIARHADLAAVVIAIVIAALGTAYNLWRAAKTWGASQ